MYNININLCYCRTEWAEMIESIKKLGIAVNKIDDLFMTDIKIECKDEDDNSDSDCR